MRFRSLDHVGFSVSNLEQTIKWWSTFLGERPFLRGTRHAAETQNYVGRILGYEACDLSVAVWSLPGGTVLEMLQYHNPPCRRVDMESYNIGNAHLCLETADMDGDYARMKGLAEFRSPEPVTSVFGPYMGSRICYLRDPDGISIELVEFPPSGRPFEAYSAFSSPYGRELSAAGVDLAFD